MRVGDIRGFEYLGGDPIWEYAIRVFGGLLGCRQDCQENRGWEGRVGGGKHTIEARRRVGVRVWLVGQVRRAELRDEVLPELVRVPILQRFVRLLQTTRTHPHSHPGSASSIASLVTHVYRYHSHLSHRVHTNHPLHTGEAMQASLDSCLH